MPKLVICSYSFKRGGAALAAKNFATLATNFTDVICVAADRSEVPKINSVMPSALGRFTHIAKMIASRAILRLMHDGIKVKHSLNLFSSRNIQNWIRRAGSETSVLHLHWINNDCLRIGHFQTIPSGSIVTLHDEWLYCGAEHYYLREEGTPKEFVVGYTRNDRRVSGLNLNYLTWQKKLNALKGRSDLIFTTPSTWLQKRAKSSVILKDKDVRLLPNPIDTGTFRPLSEKERHEIRESHGISSDHFTIAIGATGDLNYLKGSSVFRGALNFLATKLAPETQTKVVILLFGSSTVGISTIAGYSTIYLGRVSSPERMREIYGASDLVVVPSLLESFGQVAAESLACETPVAAFNCSGLTDIIIDRSSGFLATPYQAESLAKSILEAINTPTDQLRDMGRAGRTHVVEKFSPEVVGRIYKDIFQDAIKLKVKSTTTPISTLKAGNAG